MYNNINQKDKIFVYIKTFLMLFLLALSAWYTFYFLIKIKEDTKTLSQDQVKISLIYWILAFIIYIGFLIYYIYKFINLYKYIKKLSAEERTQWEKQNTKAKSLILISISAIAMLAVVALSWWYVRRTLLIVENNNLSFQVSNILAYIIIFTSPFLAVPILLYALYVLNRIVNRKVYKKEWNESEPKNELNNYPK